MDTRARPPHPPSPESNEAGPRPYRRPPFFSRHRSKGEARGFSWLGVRWRCVRLIYLQYERVPSALLDSAEITVETPCGDIGTRALVASVIVGNTGRRSVLVL